MSHCVELRTTVIAYDQADRLWPAGYIPISPMTEGGETNARCQEGDDCGKEDYGQKVDGQEDHDEEGHYEEGFLPEVLVTQQGAVALAQEPMNRPPVTGGLLFLGGACRVNRSWRFPAAED